jgi:hypothetical protein
MPSSDAVSDRVLHVIGHISILKTNQHAVSKGKKQQYPHTVTLVLQRIVDNVRRTKERRLWGEKAPER